MVGKVIGKAALKAFKLQQEAKVFKRGLSLLKEVKSIGIRGKATELIGEAKVEVEKLVKNNKALANNLMKDKYVRNAFIKKQATNALVSKKIQNLYEDYRISKLAGLSNNDVARKAVINELKKLPPAKLYNTLKKQKLELDKARTVDEYYNDGPYEVMFSSSFIDWAIFDLLPGEKNIGYITIKASGTSKKNPGSIYRFPALFPRRVWDEMLIANTFGGSIGSIFWNKFFRRWRSLGSKANPFKVKSWTKNKKK